MLASRLRNGAITVIVRYYEPAGTDATIYDPAQILF